MFLAAKFRSREVVRLGIHPERVIRQSAAKLQMIHHIFQARFSGGDVTRFSELCRPNCTKFWENTRAHIRGASNVGSTENACRKNDGPRRLRNWICRLMLYRSLT